MGRTLVIADQAGNSKSVSSVVIRSLRASFEGNDMEYIEEERVIAYWE